MTSQIIEKYNQWLLARPWLAILASIFFSIAAAVGAMRLEFNNDYRAFFSEDNPHLLAFERQQNTFSKNDNILFVITPAAGEVFDKQTLTAIKETTDAAWSLPYVLRVDSLTNFPYSRADGDTVTVGHLIDEASFDNPAALESAKQSALSDPRIVHQLVNRSATVTAVNITLQLPEVSGNETPEVVDAVRELKATIERKYDVDVRLSGIVMLSNAFYEAAFGDMLSLVPLMYLFIIFIALVFLRSVLATASMLVVICLSMAAGLGAAGWIGIQLTPPSSAATTIIMTLAVADAVHILTIFLSALNNGASKYEAIQRSLRVNIVPVFITSVTTAVGFLSLNSSDAPPFRDLGNITAIGVLCAFVLSLSLLPAMLAILPFRARQGKTKSEIGTMYLCEFLIQHRKKVMGLTLGTCMAAVIAVPSIEFDDSFVDYFDQSVPFKQDADYVNENLTGIYQIQFSLDSGADYGIANPEFLAKVDSFSKWLRSHADVTHVSTYTDTIKRLNFNMHNDAAEFYRLPSESDLAAQYLLLYELSLPEGLDLNNQMDISRSQTQLVATVVNLSSSDIAAFVKRSEAHLLESYDLRSLGVGPVVMFAHISKSNIKNMMFGSLVAILIISALIGLALKSVRLGALSLIPNVMPIATAFGIWALIDGTVNVAVSMVTGMAMGIVVDDTVHFLSKYLKARREDRLNCQDAIRYAFSTVGPAIIVTSIVLIAGFAILSLSTFAMNSNMATLTAIAIAMALLIDFLLLPTLLLVFDRAEYKAALAHNPVKDVMASKAAFGRDV